MAHTLRHLTHRSPGLLFVAVLFATICPPGRGAQPEDAPVFRFTVFALRPIEKVVFQPRRDSAPQQVRFHPITRSPRYEYRGTMPLRFTDAESGALLGEAIIPAGVRDALLIFIAAAGAEPPGMRYQIAVLDDGAPRHPPGCLAIVNLSGLSLSGVAGRHAVILKQGLHAPLEIGTSAAVTLRAAFNEKTYQSLAEQIEIGRDERALLLLFPPYYDGSLEVQSRLLVDRPPPKPEPDTTRR